MNKSLKLIYLLEGYQTFIINVHASDDGEALEKIIANRLDYKGSEYLLQKNNIIQFYDKLKRPLGQILDLIRLIVNKDPRIKSADGDTAGVMEISPGDWIFFGCGKT
jgi:hypothetical protein